MVTPTGSQHRSRNKHLGRQPVQLQRRFAQGAPERLANRPGPPPAHITAPATAGTVTRAEASHLAGGRMQHSPGWPERSIGEFAQAIVLRLSGETRA